MNKNYKVIWSKAKNCYVVVSERAKSQSKGCSGKKMLAMLVAAGVMATGAGAVEAAVAVDKNTKAVTMSDADVAALNKLIGTANVLTANQTGKNIQIGEGSTVSSYVGQHGQVAIGEDAMAWSGSGQQERYLRFGQTGVHFDWSNLSYVFDDGSKLPASIAIGKGSVARSGSVTIGDHGYQGKLGDIKISGSTASNHMQYQQDALATTIGTNSYGNGALSAVTGAYSIISSKYDGTNNKWHAVQNIGATIYGSLNSIESASSDSYYSGIASSVLGFANRTQNANAALIWGSGNEITNSIEGVSISYEGWGDKSVSDAQQAAIKELQTTNYAGGSVVAIGGGNKADYATYSQMLGVQNKIIGTDKDTSKFDVLDGYKNTVTKASNVTLIGTLNEVEEGAHYNKVIGDNHKIASGKTHNVILGSADELTEHSASDAVIIGHNAKVNADKGVAIGSGSVAEAAVGTASTTINGKTYNFAGTTPVATVSVGAAGAERTITNVAAGRISATSTDAINGSQLYATNQAIEDAAKEAAKHTVVKAGSNVTVSKATTDGQTTYTVNADVSKEDVENAKTHYYSVKGDGDLFNLYVNKNNDGATQAYGMAAGMNTSSQGYASTVVGNNTLIGGTTSSASGFQGATAIASGAFNAINTTGGAFDGVANSVYGQANITQNANAALIYGAGNTITNSYEDVDMSGGLGNLSGITDPVEMIQAMQEAVGASGGKVMAMGGLNKADYAKNSQLIGVKNTLKGTADNASEYDLLDGFENTVTEADHVTVIGSHNTVNAGADNNTIIGDKHTIAASKKNNVIIGSADDVTTTSANDAVVIGHNAKVNADKGVAIGSGSVAEAAVGTASTTINGKTYNFAGTTPVATVSVGAAGAERTITNVAAGRISATSTDAINGSQLYATNQAIEEAKTEAAKHSTVTAGDNITVTPETKEDGSKDYKVALNKDITVDSVTAGGTKISSAGLSIGDKVYVSSAGLNANSQRITNVAAGVADTDAVNVSQLKQAVAEGNTDTHIKEGTYKVGDDNTVSMDVVDKTGAKTGEVKISDVAKASDIGNVDNFNDNVKNKDGSKTTVVDAINNIDGRVTNIENNITEVSKKHSTVTAGDNIKVTESTNTAGGKDYTVALDKDITVDSVTAGKTKISNDGVAYDGKTYINGDGINANNQKVTNVAAGTISATSTDAVNGSQLYQTNQQVINNSTRISKLGDRINKVGAGAAALAALHPLDFDPDAKWDFAVGFGNYHGENAGAVGAYYRPNEDTMFSVGGTFGNGENMVNAGLSLKLGAGSSHVNTSKVAMAKEVKALRSELEAMKSAMLDANAGKKIDTSKLQLFPDVPQNHWAYEYVAVLAGNGLIEGYPDGTFDGQRPMTRYEFAAMLYRSMLNGAVLSDKILTEFARELEYFTVDTVSKDKDGNPTIQRVRTVKANKNK